MLLLWTMFNENYTWRPLSVYRIRLQPIKPLKQDFLKLRSPTPGQCFLTPWPRWSRAPSPSPCRRVLSSRCPSPRLTSPHFTSSPLLTLSSSSPSFSVESILTAPRRGRRARPRPTPPSASEQGLGSGAARCTVPAPVRAGAQPALPAPALCPPLYQPLPSTLHYTSPCTAGWLGLISAITSYISPHTSWYNLPVSPAFK